MKEKNMTLTNLNFRRLLGAAGVSITEFAELYAQRFNKDKGLVFQHSSGHRGVGAVARRRYIELFRELGLHVTEEDFFKEPLALTSEEKLRPVFDVQAGQPTEFTDMGFPVGHSTEYMYAETRDPNSYWLRVHGDSMIGEDIRERDYVLVEPNRQVVDGDIVFFRLRETVGIKKFYRRNDHIILQPMNPRHEPIFITDRRDLQEIIIQKVTGLRRRL